MKLSKTSFLLILLFVSVNAFAQITYRGFIGQSPIELLLEAPDAHNSDYIRAVYVYTKYDTPIEINGTFQNGKIILFEKGLEGDSTATLTFDHFDVNQNVLKGVWTNLKTQKQLPIVLNKAFTIDRYGDKAVWPEEKEIIQSESFEKYYFKLLVHKKTEHSPRVTGVKIIEKGTDRLLQKITMDCDFRGMLFSVSIEDCNFDGFPDFGVYEGWYTHTNMASLYFLYDPQTNLYFESGFKGMSLWFDQKSKQIHEVNQCCMGTWERYAWYKVVDNKMILISEKCMRYNEEKKDFVEVECE